MRTTLTTALLLATTLALAASPGRAQGTAEQREACTPDAVRLCSDTIPDVGRTTACMASHRGELSPRCRAAFDAGSAPTPRTRVARERRAPKVRAPETGTADATKPSIDMAEPSPPPVRTTTHHRHVRVARGDRDTREARRVIGRLCASNLLDGGTCGFMGRVLTLAE